MSFSDFIQLVGPQMMALVSWVMFGLFLLVGWMVKRGLTRMLEALERVPSKEVLEALKRIPEKNWFTDVKAGQENVLKLLAAHEKSLNEHTQQIEGLEETAVTDHARISNSELEITHMRGVLQIPERTQGYVERRRKPRA